jgi:glucose-6-phosphate-specific signal transduction histidine kinase
MSKIHQVEEELLKKVRPRHNPTLTDNLPFEKAVCIVLDLMDFFEFHHTQIVRLNNNRNQELLV